MFENIAPNDDGRRCGPAKQVAVRVKSTGQILEVWPVDARELVTLAPDEYSYVAEGDATIPQAEPAQQLACNRLAERVARWGVLTGEESLDTE